MVPDVVDDDVVALRALRVVRFRVIHDFICADGPDHLHIPGAADAGHVRAERLGDLHRERPDASRRAVDQDLLARPDLTLVAQALQRRHGGDGNRRRLLERHVPRLQHDAIRRDCDVLGQRAGSRAEHVVARFEPGDTPADRLHRPRKVDAEADDLWLPETGVEAHEVRRASHEVPVKRIDGSRANSYQDLIATSGRLLNLFTLENTR